MENQISSIKKTSQFKEVTRRLFKNKLAIAGLVFIVLLIFIMIFADFLAPYGYAEQDFTATYQGPSAKHLLGTDHLGRDILSRLIYGSRISMEIAVLSVALSATIGITIDSGAKVTGDSIVKETVSGGYKCTYTPTTALADGSHTIKIDASDYDGNAATQKSVTCTVDTVPPTLSITAPADKLITNKTGITVKGTTNDKTSSPVTVTVKLNSGAATAVTVESDGSFSKDLTLVVGTNTITVVARDAAGKSTTVTRTVTVDQTAPVIKSITINPNPVDCGKTYIISVEVTD